MSRRRLMYREQFSWNMTRAINAAYAEGAELLLLSAKELQVSPQMLGPFVHKALQAPSFAQATDFKTHGHRIDAEFMPKNASDYESNLRRIVEALGKHGADMMLPNQQGEIAAQAAFNGTTQQMQHRWPTCFAVVAQTLLQHPNWLPDFEQPLRTLNVLPGDADAAEKRRGMADHMGALGCEIGQWLKHYSEPGKIRETAINHAPIVGDMLAANRAFWMRDNWNLDSASMAWSSQVAGKVPQSTPNDDPLFAQALRSTIEFSQHDVARGLLSQNKAAPQLLGELLHEILDAPSRTEKAHETKLAAMARLFIVNGANVTVLNEMGDTPAQRCFNNANDDRGQPNDKTTRWGVCTEIMRGTLINNPAWKPDYNRLFTSLTYKPEDSEAAGHRQDIANWANALAADTHGWLNSQSPTAINVRRAMSAETQEFWNKNKGMHCDAEQMPWMNHSQLHGEALKQALAQSGLTFAFGTKITDGAATTQNAIAKAKGKLPPPTA